jgi:hypothetical protein
VPKSAQSSHTSSSAPSTFTVFGEDVSAPHISHWTMTDTLPRPRLNVTPPRWREEASSHEERPRFSDVTCGHAPKATGVRRVEESETLLVRAGLARPNS